MSDGMTQLISNAMNGKRCDYAKFKFRAEYDLAQQHAQSVAEVVAHYQSTVDAGGGWKAHKLRVEETGKALWSIELWGPAAEAVCLLPFEPWSDWVERLDVRQEVSTTDDGMEAFYQHLKTSGTGNRMLTQFDQRKRQKQNGRSGGGRGFAVGSHKSDFRMSVYRRGGEAGAIEFQLSGDRIERALDSVRMMKEEDAHKPDFHFWGALFTQLHGSGWFEAQKVCGVSKGDMLGIVGGDALPPRSTEAQLEAIERLLGELPREAQVGLFQQLQLSLFS